MICYVYSRNINFSAELLQQTGVKADVMDDHSFERTAIVRSGI